MSYTSRWRLVCSADSEAGARAAAASFVVGLLLDEPAAAEVAPYFKGGFQAELFVAHGEDAEAAGEWVRGRLERLTVDWTAAEEPGELLRAWSQALNVPRLEALEVLLFEDAQAEEDSGAGGESDADPEGEDPPAPIAAADDA